MKHTMRETIEGTEVVRPRKYAVRVSYVVTVDRDAWEAHFGKRPTNEDMRRLAWDEAEANILAGFSLLIPDVLTVKRSVT